MRIVSSSVAAGKHRRMRRLLREDGRTVIVALDHASFMGASGPAYGEPLRAIAQAQPDAVLATWNLARTHAELFARSGLILRLDGGTTELGGHADADHGDLLYTVDQALTLGADAVAVMGFPGTPDEHRSLQRLARLCAACEPLGMPVMAEMIPGGWARTVPWTAETIAHAVRIGAELGADLIKTACPGEPSEFASVVGSCPVPVVALGGPKMSADDDIVRLAHDVVAAGGAGIAFGRNVWGAPDPGELLRRLHHAVHGVRGDTPLTPA